MTQTMEQNTLADSHRNGYSYVIEEIKKICKKMHKLSINSIGQLSNHFKKMILGPVSHDFQR